MSRQFDTIVIGVGAMGAAACHELARRGVRVLGLEQFDIPHGRGSSHGFSRMIRLCYYEHPDYVPLLRRAYELWGALEDESGQKLLHLTGGLYMGPASSELMTGSRDAATTHGLEHEVLDAAGVADRYPQFRLPGDYAALYEPMAGWIAPEKAICAFAELAMRKGAALHGHEPVRNWVADSSGVRVTTDQAVYHAEKLVFCGGPWSGDLLAGLNLELVVTRQVMLWVWPKRPELFASGRLPVWAVGHADGSLHYGFPMAGDGVGFKLAHHAPGEPVDPEQVARERQPGDEQSVRQFIGRFLPDADGPTLASRVCLYTNSRDSHFIVDHHPRHDRVTLACGFSGHGFKFASVIGQALAELSMLGRTDLPVDFLSLRRFT
jgi:sarcosine oxidase